MSAPREPIAVVGAACRYPDAGSPEELLRTVLSGRRAFRRLPEQRLGAAYRGDGPDGTRVTRAGLLRDWEFDRTRFGIPGPLFRAADLTHWLALEVASDLLADTGAGARGDDLPVHRDRVGVVLGNSLTGEFSRAGLLRSRLPFVRTACDRAMARRGVDAEVRSEVLGELTRLVHATFPPPGDESLAGALSNTIAGRICNHFDLHGTGYTVDGACASSLLAVMTACRALRDGELDLVLAGGVDLSLDPLELVGFARLGAMADGPMRIYDREPTGFLPGEGCGMVALARAGDAERLALPVRALIPGWGTSSDGAGGLTRPETSGQALALRRAYALAGIEPARAGLIEGHGTGTAVGDRVELEALTEVRGRGTDPAVLSGVKANLGHTKAAAGVAGLIKAVLAVESGVLPPITGCEDPHPLLCSDGVPLRLLDAPESWTGPDRTAGVSSMGFGGINTHVLVSATGDPAPPVPAEALRRWSARPPEPDLVVLRAADPDRLADLLEETAAWGAALCDAEVHDLAATTRAAGPAGGARAALVVTGADDLARACRAAAELLRADPGRCTVDARAGVAVGAGPPARVGLLLPGQAAPVRERLAPWATSLGVPEAPGPVPPGATAARGAAGGTVDTAVAQPAIVRQSLAALAWLDVLGTRAVGATGHSLGELTALVWAGALTPAAGLDLAARRGALMSRYGRPGTGMASLATDPDHLRQLLAADPITGDCVVAGYNGPHQTAIAGPAGAVWAVVSRAREDGVAGAVLPVSHGFHSAAMEPVREHWAGALEATPFDRPRTLVVSTTTGAAVGADTDLRALLVTQLTEPVRFVDAVADLAARCDLLVEAGPGDVLTGLTRTAVPHTPVVTLDSGGDPRAHALATAALVAGGQADPAPFDAGARWRPLPPNTPIRLLSNPCEQLEAAGDPARPAEPKRGRDVARERTGAATGAGPAPVDHGEVSGGNASDPLTMLREHLGATLELPVAAVPPGADLLGDLHLTSLQVVQTAVELARRLDRDPGIPLESLAGATVEGLAALLDGLPPAGTRATVRRGVRAAVHAVAHRSTRSTGPDRPAGPTAWRVRASDGHWLHDLGTTPGAPDGLAVVLDGDSGPHRWAAVLGEVAARPPQRLLVLHRGDPAAAALGRSAAVEQAGCAVTVAELPDEVVDGGPGDLLDRITSEVTGDGYREVVLCDDGTARVAGSVPFPLGRGGTGAAPLGRAEVVLVTGGLGGITADAVADLVGAAGARMVVLGRSDPGSERVARSLAGLADRCRVDYLRCDVTDREQVRAAVGEAGRLGPVTGLVHGAGINEPRAMGAVDAASLERSLAPKADGLEYLLAELGLLRFVVAFGSVIGRCGLRGQSEYAVANDVMRVILERWAARNPDTRCHVLEWSVWAGRGMGDDLGVGDGLAAAGVGALPPDLGRDALRAVLGDPDAPVTLLLLGHFPATPTLPLAAPRPDPDLRFTEEREDLLAGIEAEFTATLSLGSDPHLDDHRIGGVAVLPAVLGLEAMVQAARTLTGGDTDGPSAVRDARFSAPVTVPDHDERVLRVAALRAGDDVEVVLRDDSDGYASDRFTGVVVAPAEPPPAVRPARPATADARDVCPLYGGVFFHDGRYRRVQLFDWVSTSAVRARVHAEERPQGWFSDFVGGRQLLGDAGAHDATLHALLACVPHRVALPTGVEHVTFWRPPAGLLEVVAVERGRGRDEYVFDVEVRDADGRPVGTWRGLTLSAVGSAPRGPVRHTPQTAATRLARCGIELGLAGGLDLAFLAAGATPETVDELHPAPPGHRAVAELGTGSLAAVADRPVRLVTSDRVPAGADEQEAGTLAEKVVAEGGVDPATALVRARNGLAALGRTATRPVLETVTDEGVVVLTAGTGAGALAAGIVAGTGTDREIAVAFGTTRGE